MTRGFPRGLSGTMAGGALGLCLLGTACAPTSDIKSGAPVLTSFIIAEPSGTKTTVGPMTTDCPAALEDGGDCDPATTVCKLADSVCHCDTKTMPPETTAVTMLGTATCSYDPRASVAAVFDRLIDGDLLDLPDGGGGSPSAVNFGVVPAPPMTVAVVASYIPNGADTGIVFPLFFGVASGPSLVITGQPALPTDSAVTYTLNPDHIKSHDGKLSFAGQQLLQAGAISLRTQPFRASIAVPQPPMVMTGAVTVAFNNTVSPDEITKHIAVSADGTPLAAAELAFDTTMAPTISVRPAKNWPASAVISIAVDGDAADVLGDKLGAIASGMFTTGAM